MSTSYRPLSNIGFQALKDSLGKHKNINLSIHFDKDDPKGKESFAVTNGESYLWCYNMGDDTVQFCRYGLNTVDEFIDKIAEHFEVDIVSEHEAGYFQDEDEDEDE